VEDRNNFKEHIEKYNDLRNKVYAEIPKVINMPGVKLTPINSLALSAYLRWPNNDRLPPNGGWDWSSWVKHYRKKHPKRFEAAIWFGGNLCGLLLGRMSGKNIHVRLEVLEGSTDINHPLKGRIAYISLSSIEMFGYILGAKESRIIDPVDGAVNSYRKLGYVLLPSSNDQPRYLAKTL